MKILNVQELPEGALEIYEIATKHKRDKKTVFLSRCGKAFVETEIETHYANIAEGDYLMVDIEGNVGHEIKNTFEQVVPTLEALKIPYTFE